MWPFKQNSSTARERQARLEKAAYERGRHDGHNAGWADGKTKAMQEILNVLEGGHHATDCGYRPCLVIRACRGEVKVVEALRGVVDLGELPYYPDQVDGIMLISCTEAPEDDDCGHDEGGYCAHGRMLPVGPIRRRREPQLRIQVKAHGRLSPNPPKRCALALTPGLMGKGGGTGQARIQ